jgi:hypothetical protein
MRLVEDDNMSLVLIMILRLRIHPVLFWLLPGVFGSPMSAVI